MLDALRIELWVVTHQRLDCNFDVGLALFVPKAADREGAPVSHTDGDDRYPRAKHAAYKIKYRECTHSPSASPTSYPCRFTMEGSESLAVGVTNRRAHSGVQRVNAGAKAYKRQRNFDFFQKHFWSHLLISARTPRLFLGQFGLYG